MIGSTSVLIHSPLNVKTEEIFSAISTLPALQPYCEEVIGVISRLSSLCLSPENKLTPELIALGYWLRQIRKQPDGDRLDIDVVRKAIGVVVHFTPTNVDTMFAYSWATSLVLGNNNIVRLPSQQSELQQRLIAFINKAIEASPAIAQRNVFIGYEKDSQWTRTLSQYADARVIWGGDDTVMAVRSIPAKPRTRDIGFADRYSACFINVDELKDVELMTTAEKLARDTALYQQQACSSPKVVFFQGNSDVFNDILRRAAGAMISQLTTDQSTRNEQLVMAQSIVAQYGGRFEWHDGIMVVQPDSFNPDVIAHHVGLGGFIVVPVENMGEIASLVDDKIQTLSYAGVSNDSLLQFASSLSIKGIDRVVEVGYALDFDIIWDGFNLGEQLTRYVRVK